MKYIQLCLAVMFAAVAACSAKTEIPQAVQESPYFLAQDAVIDVDGVTARYRSEGPEDAQPIVMVHGFSSSLETWDALAADLSADYRVIRVDLPGHGLTGPDPQARYTNDDTVTFLENFIAATGLENPVLVGNSLGGLVSWRLAAKTPDAVSGLVLIAPGGFSINGVTETPVEVPMMVKFYLTKAPEAGVKQATAALYGDPAKLTDARAQSVLDMMTRPGNGDAFVARAAAFTLPDPAADLAKVTTPSLIIWGEKDIMVPADHSDKFIAAMPNAGLKIYKNTGHVPQEETPEKLAADIRAFLSPAE